MIDWIKVGTIDNDPLVGEEVLAWTTKGVPDLVIRTPAYGFLNQRSHRVSITHYAYINQPEKD